MHTEMIQSSTVSAGHEEQMGPRVWWDVCGAQFVLACICLMSACLFLHVQELLKYSTDCEGTSELQGALTAMLDLLKSVNDSMHQIAITGYKVRRLF